jgi:integrase
MKFAKPWYRKSRRAWFVTLDGRQIKLGTTKGQALGRYQELLAQPKKRVVPSGSLLAIIDAFLDWCQKHRAPATYEWYRSRLELFAQKHPHLRTVDVRPFHVQQWIDAMNVSSGTKRNYCRSVKRCLAWAKKQGHIDVNPIADLEQPRAGKRELVVTQEQFDELLSLTVDESFHDLLIVTWETGCRPQESLRVEARHVDLGNQRWIFSKTESKTDMPRIVYLTDDALAITRRLLVKYPEGPLFRNANGRPWTTDAVNSVFVRLQIKIGRQLLEQKVSKRPKDRRRKYIAVGDAEVREFLKTLSPLKQSGEPKSKAELLFEARRKLTYREAMRIGPKYSLYALRHTWMNRLLTKGVDALTVAFLAGHSDPSTLARVYAHLSQDPVYLLGQVKRATG